MQHTVLLPYHASSVASHERGGWSSCNIGAHIDDGPSPTIYHLREDHVTEHTGGGHIDKE